MEIETKADEIEKALRKYEKAKSKIISDSSMDLAQKISKYDTLFKKYCNTLKTLWLIKEEMIQVD